MSKRTVHCTHSCGVKRYCRLCVYLICQKGLFTVCIAVMSKDCVRLCAYLMCQKGLFTVHIAVMSKWYCILGVKKGLYAYLWCQKDTVDFMPTMSLTVNEQGHEISNNVVCATSKCSDQPAHTRSLIRAFASRLNILWALSYWTSFGVSNLKRRLHRLAWVYNCLNTTLLEITCIAQMFCLSLSRHHIVFPVKLAGYSGYIPIVLLIMGSNYL